LAALLFVVPVLLVYEVGVVLLGPQAIRNGADVWLRSFLEVLDLGQYFLLPLLTVSILLGWHYTTQRPWRVGRGVLPGMLVECIVLAICLRFILQIEILFWQSLVQPTAAVAPNTACSMAGMVGYLGAGVYEELLFRLILLTAAAFAVRRCGASPQASTILAVVLTSLIFSAAHYVGTYGEPIVWGDRLFWFGVVFRFLAGVFFSILFVWRGFGIAVGAHAGYDILVRLF
jgi:hypothetical protein